ncbi:hypothetical protein E3N88_03813 [Mikania micrantha]|uniref:Uncharacterized protein n=1 Tax=Mikania micrantha TaxID=192012 RepID=A0A5N6PSJ3_9ASTR|nr:hypothetical protein E3N88_03813 [Mikania micrantha]
MLATREEPAGPLEIKSRLFSSLLIGQAPLQSGKVSGELPWMVFGFRSHTGSFSLDLDIDVEDEVHKDFLRSMRFKFYVSSYHASVMERAYDKLGSLQVPEHHLQVLKVLLTALSSTMFKGSKCEIGKCECISIEHSCNWERERLPAHLKSERERLFNSSIEHSSEISSSSSAMKSNSHEPSVEVTILEDFHLKFPPFSFHLIPFLISYRLTGRLLENDQYSQELGSFDLVVGMNWLSHNKAQVVCSKKQIKVPLNNGEVLTIQATLQLAWPPFFRPPLPPWQPINFCNLPCRLPPLPPWPPIEEAV